MVNRRKRTGSDWIPDHESFGAIFGQTYAVVGDRDLLRAGLDFANGDAANNALRANTALEMAQRGLGVRKAFAEATIDDAIARDREQARLVMRAAVEDLSSLEMILRMFVKLHPRGFGIVRRPSFGITSTGSTGVEWTLDLDDVPSSGGRRFDHALAYVGALLYTDEFQCRSKLRRCKLESCARFFYFEREPGKGGRPRDAYCSTEHLDIAHQKDSARRHREAKRKRIEKEQARKQQRRRHK